MKLPRTVKLMYFVQQQQKKRQFKSHLKFRSRVKKTGGARATTPLSGTTRFNGRRHETVVDIFKQTAGKRLTAAAAAAANHGNPPPSSPQCMRCACRTRERNQTMSVFVCIRTSIVKYIYI